jgi:glycosyltransferase involved in cell wall biosynthesis
MKTIVIYTPTWPAFGGGEKYVILLAEAVSKLPDVSVTLLSSDASIKKSQLEQFAHTDLSKVNYQIIDGISRLKNSTLEADIFVCLSNFQKIRSSSRTHVQLLQIPYGKINAASLIAKFGRMKFSEAAKDILRLRLLSFARDGANLIISNSEFVGETLYRNFGIRNKVLYPPIQDYYREGISKKNIILSVGRFFSGLYNAKRYDILTEAFRKLCRSGLDGWEYHIVGSAMNDAKTQQFLSELREQNKEYPIHFHVNESYDSLLRLYNEATIFWHGAGYGVDENSHPENVEHFGMTTVEAMSAGCVPVVINKGGQRESVSHGENGFLWNTIDELIAYSLDVANGRVPTSSMRDHARQSYLNFNIDNFQRRVIELFSPLLT